MKVELAFFSNSIILLAIIIALTVFRVFSCRPFKEDGEEFNPRKLVLGIIANCGILITLSFVYFIGAYFGGDLAVIQIGEAVYTVQAALNALIILAIGVYGIKLYRNAVEFFGLNKEAKDAKGVVSEVSVIDYNLGTEVFDEIKG